MKQPMVAFLSSRGSKQAGLTVAAVLFVYAVSLWSAVSSTINEVSDFDLSEPVSGESTVDETIASSLANLDSLTESAAKTRRVATPVLVACGVTGFVPFVSENCDAAESLLDRFDANKNAAISLLNAVQTMSDQLDSFRAESGGSSVNGRDWSRAVDDVRHELTEFELSIELARNVSDGSMDGVISLLARSHEKARLTELEMIRLAEFVNAGVTVLDSAVRLQQAAEIALGDLKKQGGRSANFDAVRSALDGIDPSVREFSRDIERFTGSVPPYLEGSNIEKQIVSLGADANLIADLILSVSVPITLFAESFEGVKSSDDPLLTDGGLTLMLNNLIAKQDVLSEASDNLVDAHDSLSGDGELRRLLGPSVASTFGDLLDQYLSLIKSMSEIPEVLSLLLGSTGEKRYLVLGQNSDELRPAGGFTSSAWVLTVDNGRLVDTEYINILRFGERRVLDRMPEVPSELNVHMNAGGWYLRDVGWSPDFKSVAELALLMNDSAGYESIDGVISITQWAFVYLVKGLGEIETPEGVMSGDEVISAIEEGTDAEGTGYLVSLFDSIVDSLSVESLKDNFAGFSGAVLRSFGEKQIMIYSTDEELQASLVNLGWSGEFSWDGRDLVGVFDSNIGWNKVGRNIERSVKYEIEIEPDGASSARLSISYENLSTGGETGCLRQTEPPANARQYDDLKNGCYWNLMRIYTPVGVESKSMTVLPAPLGSVAVRSRSLRENADTSSMSWDDVGQYFSGLVVTDSGNTSTVVYEYLLPDGVVEVEGSTLRYNLYVPVQAGVPKTDLEIRVGFPNEYQIVDSNIESELSDRNEFSFSTILSSDLKLYAVAEKLN